MKVAIVARAPTNVAAPFHDTSWRIWGLPWVRYPRVDLVFEMHEQACWDAVAARGEPIQ